MGGGDRDGLLGGHEPLPADLDVRAELRPALCGVVAPRVHGHWATVGRNGPVPRIVLQMRKD
jgi:hypothetical protein